MGDPLGAVDQLRELLAKAQFEEFIDLSVARFTELYQGPWREYSDLVDSIAPEVVDRHPELLVIAAAASSWFEPHTAMGWARVERAVALMRKRSESEPSPRVRVRMAGVELGAFRILNRSSEAAAAAARFESVVDALPAETLLASAEMVHVFAVQVVGAYAIEGRFPEAARALSRLDDDANTWRHVHARSMVAMSHAISGDISTARRLVRSMTERFAEVAWHGSYNAVGWNIASALVAVEDGDGDAALELLDALDPQLSAVDHWAYILSARGRALALTRPASEAVDSLQELFTEHRGRRASQFSIDLLRATFADLLLASGQVERARQMLDAVGGIGPSALARSRLLLRDSPVEARSLASEILTSNALSPRSTAEALLTQAIAALRLGLPAEAEALMARLAAGIDRRECFSVVRLAPRAEVLALLPSGHSGIAERVRALPENHDGGIATPVALTAAETRVLQGLVRCRGTRELAEELFLSQNTVKTHLRRIYRKLGAQDRASAIAIATRHGLLA